ncbi:MAG: DUF423 domain-containing protein [Beijerinckiaceae bacterium]|nr:DUF423 domain-containing protein [Beijerinckiaceae bacterium]
MSLAALAGLLGASGVGLAAIAAHLSGEPTLKTAADFLLFHGAALLAVAAMMRGNPHRGLLAAGSLIGFGTILFCGDLALRALAGARLFPFAAPSGGLLLIAGWLVCAAAAPLSLRNER